MCRKIVQKKGIGLEQEFLTLVPQLLGIFEFLVIYAECYMFTQSVFLGEGS